MVFHSFIDYAASRGIRPRERKERPFTCRKCGGEMKHIPGTNVLLCECEREVEGKKVLCGNQVLLRAAF